MEKVEIKNIEFKVGKKQLNLTVEEAKKLKAILDELFGKEKIKEVKEIHYHDTPYYPYRWWWEIGRPSGPQYQPPDQPPIFYCNDNSGTAQMENTTLQITC